MCGICSRGSVIVRGTTGIEMMHKCRLCKDTCDGGLREALIPTRRTELMWLWTELPASEPQQCWKVWRKLSFTDAVREWTIDLICNQLSMVLTSLSALLVAATLVSATSRPLEGFDSEDRRWFAFPMEEMSLITEGNDRSLPSVVSLGGLLFLSVPFEKQIDYKTLPAVGVEFGSGCAELRRPAAVWP